jgi:uncharacterized repeat protein (TIGR03809 family)
MRAKTAYRLPTGDIARKWQWLAERRRTYLVELYRSGRWRRCYSEEAFRHQLNEATAELAAWEALAKEEVQDSEEIQAAQADAIDGDGMHVWPHDGAGHPSG